MVFQADFPEPLGGELLVDHRFHPHPQGRLVRCPDLLPSVRHPRKGKRVKRRELGGRTEISVHLDVIRPRAASDSEQPQRHPLDQESDVHLVTPPTMRPCNKLEPILLSALTQESFVLEPTREYL